MWLLISFGVFWLGAGCSLITSLNRGVWQVVGDGEDPKLNQFTLADDDLVDTLLLITISLVLWPYITYRLMKDYEKDKEKLRHEQTTTDW